MIYSMVIGQGPYPLPTYPKPADPTLPYPALVPNPVRVFIYCACLRGVLLLIAPALVIAYALMHPPREYLL